MPRYCVITESCKSISVLFIFFFTFFSFTFCSLHQLSQIVTVKTAVELFELLTILGSAILFIFTMYKYINGTFLFSLLHAVVFAYTTLNKMTHTLKSFNSCTEYIFVNIRLLVVWSDKIGLLMFRYIIFFEISIWMPLLLYLHHWILILVDQNISNMDTKAVKGAFNELSRYFLL